MRKLVALPVLLAAASFAGAAQAAVAPSSTLHASTDRVSYGNPVTLTGRLSSHRAGQHIGVLVHVYGVPTRTVTVTTRAGGYWTLVSRPGRTTTYRVKVGARIAHVTTVGVQPRVTIDELGNGRILAHVQGARSFRGSEVALQRLQANGVWETVLKQGLGSASSTTFVTTLPSSTVRISMSVNQAGIGYLGSASHSMLYHDYKLTLAASTYRVSYGGTVTLNGRLQNGHAGETVTINAWPYGTSSPVRAGSVQTVKNGEWTFSAHPSIATAYQAVWEKNELSPRRTIGVAPLVTVTALANGRISVHVAAGRSLAGQEVQLQRHNGNGWVTVQKLPLLAGSHVVFLRDASKSMLRVAISVNQAGKGYLGAISRTLAQHV